MGIQFCLLYLAQLVIDTAKNQISHYGAFHFITLFSRLYITTSGAMRYFALQKLKRQRTVV
jgi:hypothetical protein